MTTHQIDARALNVGDVFFKTTLLSLRKVVRVRALHHCTEIMHGHDDHPGGLEYALFGFGQQVTVPGFATE